MDGGREKACKRTIPKISLPKVSIPLKRIGHLRHQILQELGKRRRVFLYQDKRKELSKVRSRRQFEWDDYYSNFPDWEESLKSEEITPQHPLDQSLRGKIEKKKDENAKVESKKGLEETQIKKTKTAEDREKEMKEKRPVGTVKKKKNKERKN